MCQNTSGRCRKMGVLQHCHSLHAVNSTLKARDWCCPVAPVCPFSHVFGIEARIDYCSIYIYNHKARDKEWDNLNMPVLVMIPTTFKLADFDVGQARNLFVTPELLG